MPEEWEKCYFYDGNLYRDIDVSQQLANTKNIQRRIKLVIATSGYRDRTGRG